MNYYLCRQVERAGGEKKETRFLSAAIFVYLYVCKMPFFLGVLSNSTSNLVIITMQFVIIDNNTEPRMKIKNKKK